MSWMNIIMAVGLPIIRGIIRGDDKDKEHDSLVDYRARDPLFKKSDVGNFAQFSKNFREYNVSGGRPGPVSQTPALKSIGINNDPIRVAEEIQRRYRNALTQSKVG